MVYLYILLLFPAPRTVPAHCWCSVSICWMNPYFHETSRVPELFLDRLIEKLRCRYLSDFKEFFFFDSRICLYWKALYRKPRNRSTDLRKARTRENILSGPAASNQFADMLGTCIFSKTKCNSNHRLFCGVTRPEAVPLWWQGSSKLGDALLCHGSGWESTDTTVPLLLLGPGFRDHLYVSLLLTKSAF